MKDSNVDNLEYVLGALQFVVAAVTFDSHSWNQIAVSVLLVCGGILILPLGAKSPIARRARGLIGYFAILLSFALVIKVLFFG